MVLLYSKASYKARECLQLFLERQSSPFRDKSPLNKYPPKNLNGGSGSTPPPSEAASKAKEQDIFKQNTLFSQAFYEKVVTVLAVQC